MRATSLRPPPLSSIVERVATVQLASGDVLVGRVLRFSPSADTLDVEVFPRAGHASGRMRIPCEQVAALAFALERDAKAKAAATTRLEVMLATGIRILVDAVLEPKTTKGFFAYPATPASGVAEYFFYHLAVRAQSATVAGAPSEKVGPASEIRVRTTSEKEVRGEVGRRPTSELRVAEWRQEPTAADRWTSRVLFDAIARGASSVHIETNGADRNTLIRLRIDGDCVVYKEIPPAYRRQMIARLKVMASLDTSERQRPQEGKIRLRMRDRTVELRVATLPTGNDEDMILRVLASARPLDSLSLTTHNLTALRELIARPHGLLLCVGPADSGKTTTLHALLATLNTPEMKIWTAEDPIEIAQVGLRQVEIHPSVGLTFATATRSFRSADPDVIMIGETRDRETASAAVEASLRGHLVLSTSRATSPADAITRLLDMGVKPSSLGDALLAVLAQRLVPALCASCREPYSASAEEIASLVRIQVRKAAFRSTFAAQLGAGVQLHRPRGCEACGGVGYKGRLALHELLVGEGDVTRAVARRAPVEELRRLAAARGATLAQDGVAKCLAGLTDLRQVLGACAPRFHDSAPYRP